MKLFLELLLAFSAGSAFGITSGIRIVRGFVNDAHALINESRRLNSELSIHLQKLSAKL